MRSFPAYLSDHKHQANQQHTSSVPSPCHLLTLGLKSNNFCQKSQMLREGQGEEDKTSRGRTGGTASTPKWERGSEPLSAGSKAQGARLTVGSPVPAPLAEALVRVDVGFAAGARVRHILEVVDEAGDQAAAQVTPESEMGRDREA